MKDHQQRPWDEGWAQLQQTIHVQDVWLLTDHIKVHYLSPYLRADTTALEVGCGSAKLSGLLTQQGVKVTGLDLSSQALRVAHNNFVALSVAGRFIRGDVLALPLADEQFDLVFSTGLLEHFRDPVTVIREMVRVLRPGGLFFSDIAPLKFSLLRLGFYLRGHHKQAFDEFPYTEHEIKQWLSACKLQEVRVFASGVVPPLGIIRRSKALRNFAFRKEHLWRIWDGTWVADRLGFFYLAFGVKS